MSAEVMTADRPLRVAMITTFYPPLNFGGDGQYVRRLVHALARQGCEVEVIHDADAWRVLSGAGADVPPPPPLPEPEGVTVHRLESRWPMGATLLTQQLGRPVVHAKRIEAILSRGFDVIHYHNISLVGGPGVLALGDALKFYTAHEHWLVCANHVLWRHNRELCTGRECLKCSVIHRRPPQLWRSTGLLERESAHVDTFIALSKSVAENHKAFGFKPEMTLMASFLPDAPPPERSAPPRTEGQDPFFLFVGRLEVIKGLQDVIPLFDADMPADLLIAGSGAYEPELRRLAADKPRVKFLGQTTPADLADLYERSLGLIASSRCYEVFPMVALEAFQGGVPVIARRLGPYPQIVEESGGGLLFGDEAELRAALLSLVGDRGLRERLGASGRQAVETLWSEETAVSAYLDLVRRKAQERGRPATVRRAEALRRGLAG
jgi:glycosyltransferase involved in cell wall biosynthesis